ncbi:MAG: PD40 domain-containing protein [Verrucomicrobia bacterium]|nr:PD40 domain-containing protein [Verrucomicrobiota bacterium]
MFEDKFRFPRIVRRLWLSAVISGLLAAPVLAQTPGQVFMRYPTIHGESVVFEACGNLWLVHRKGGTAQRLTTDPGFDIMPRFSPDGKYIAFTGQYQQNSDVYLIPATGGAAKRLTFHSDVVDEAPLRWGPDNMVVNWTPDSKNVVFLSRRNTFNSWFGRYFAVPVSGGLPAELPLDRGGMLSYSPDGQKIVYNRIFKNFRTWKRYDGGLAQQLYLYDFASKQLSEIAPFKGESTDPMWYGNTIYFLSDRDTNRRANLWAYDLNTKALRQITKFTDYDVDWPSIGDTGIVFQQGGSLYVLDLPSEQLHKLDVMVPDDGTRSAPRFVDASKQIRAYDISPNGKRAVFEARGDIFTVPEKDGATRDITETSNANERYPNWSPNGKLIAYVTDREHEAQIAIRPAEGGKETLLTKFDKGYLYSPVWAPGSDKLAFSDSDHQLWYVSVSGGAPVKVAHDERDEIKDYSWSPDGNWLAYSLAATNGLHQIWLYQLKDAKATLVSSGNDDDRQPVFDRNGKYLFFVSKRHANPIFSQTEFNIATLKMRGIYVATLTKGEPSLFAPRSDEGSNETEASRPSLTATPSPSATTGPIQAIKIDLDGLMERAVPVPVPAADYGALTASRDSLFYITAEGPGAPVGEEPEGRKATLHAYDLKPRKERTLVTDLSLAGGAYALSDDGSKVMYHKVEGYFIADSKLDGSKAASGGEGGPNQLNLKEMRVQIDPRQEWVEMFEQAWRLERDFFYSSKMNGVDWDAIAVSYRKLLPLCACREDLNYLIGEILGELCNSHTYVGGGDTGQEDSSAKAKVGLLGVDFALDQASGLYRFAKIYPGDNTRDDYRSPLTEPGIDVREGSYLVAVDGHELKAPTDPYTLFLDKATGTVRLTIADSPEGKTRDVVVKPVASELKLRLKAWIDHNREVADKASGGKIGYIYMSDMEGLGMEQFIQQFYPQIQKEGLIIDDRYNGGGEIDEIVLERLRRILIGMGTNRQRDTETWPSQVQNGYKVALMNQYSASDGDIFPYYFRKYGLGPLIGKRTWGGVRGIRGYWPLLDGGYITIPEFSIYNLDSEWVIENHGVVPDIEVEDLPGDLLAGHDAQLEAGINYLMKEIQEHPKPLASPPPLIPAYPPPGE